MNKELILRLSKYKRLLHKLKALGLERVFSNNLGDAIGVAPALVRKDFSILSLPGNKRGGYQIDTLIEKLDTVLGQDKAQNVIIAGCGRIGSALMEYEDFAGEGITIVAGFDINPEAVKIKGDVEILHIDEMEEYIKKNDISVGIISVPDHAASAVMDSMVQAGCRGILNFSSVELKCSRQCKDGNGCVKSCIIQNVNIGLEIEHLFYQINLTPEVEGACIDEDDV
jgi:redox-sensing transcriptional repressor